MMGSDEITALKGVLREHRLHITAARLAVLQVLTHAQGHRSVEEIRVAVLAHAPTLDPVTIYRTLEQFEAQGLATRVMLGDKLTRWERATPAHHHVVCRTCGVVLEMEPAPLRAPRRRLGARVWHPGGDTALGAARPVPGLCGRRGLSTRASHPCRSTAPSTTAIARTCAATTGRSSSAWTA
jgi:Fe2+ or Zn2+ uptake regulation protein